MAMKSTRGAAAGGQKRASVNGTLAAGKRGLHRFPHRAEIGIVHALFLPPFM
jgi:hypothetical protein